MQSALHRDSGSLDHLLARVERAVEANIRVSERLTEDPGQSVGHDSAPCASILSDEFIYMQAQ